jgi:hypothetical protein
MIIWLFESKLTQKYEHPRGKISLVPKKYFHLLPTSW